MKQPEPEPRYRWDPARGEAQRPFRLWDAVKKRNVRWRNYATRKRAELGALIETRWARVGDQYEVYDCRTGRAFVQYVRTPTSVRIEEV